MTTLADINAEDHIIWESEETFRNWFSSMVSQDLKDPKQKKVIAFLRNIAEEDKNNPSVYNIQLMKFDPKGVL